MQKSPTYYAYIRTKFAYPEYDISQYKAKIKGLTSKDIREFQAHPDFPDDMKAEGIKFLSLKLPEMLHKSLSKYQKSGDLKDIETISKLMKDTSTSSQLEATNTNNTTNILLHFEHQSDKQKAQIVERLASTLQPSPITRSEAPQKAPTPTIDITPQTDEIN